MKRPIIIGAGVAGLSACLEFEAAGCAPILLEARGELGGRLRTDFVDGVPIDHGFQVLLTAYPEVKRLLDVKALNPIRFDSGARVFRSAGGAPVLVSDPRRHPGDAMATLGSGLVKIGDGWRMLRHLRSIRSGQKFARVFSDAAVSRSTAEMLEARGYSVDLVDEFFRPFFGGIFLDRDLKTPESMFNFVLRMFASGSAVLPHGGMRAVAAQLEGNLAKTEVRKQVQAVWVNEEGTELRCADGEVIRGDGVVLAVPGLTRDVEGRLVRDNDLRWNRTVRYVWSIAPDVRRFERPIIGLTPGSKRITNMHFFRDLDPEWPDWVSVTAVGDSADVVDIADDKAMRLAFQHATGIAVRETVAMHDVRQALPIVGRQMYEPDPESTWLIDGVLKAGDDRSNPSFNGAARAGAVAAQALVSSWGSNPKQMA